MADPVNPKTRPYRSSLRQQQAQLTRRTVFAVAHRLFLERGFAATTVAAVAAEAGVSTETIYASLGGKRGLLEGVIQATILRPDTIPLRQQPTWPRIEAIANPHDRLAALVAFICEVLARTSPVHAVIRGAADSEEFAVALRQRLLEQRVTDIRSNLRRTLPEGVRRGLSWRQATERFAALASPELHHLLTVQLGWTPHQYRDWLTELLDTELLDKPDDRPDRPTA
jgi:AcrR family transcriptional regulator